VASRQRPFQPLTIADPLAVGFRLRLGAGYRIKHAQPSERKPIVEPVDYTLDSNRRYFLVLSDNIATLPRSAFPGLDPVAKFRARENADAMNRLLRGGLRCK
jgi:hypothetical protein